MRAKEVNVFDKNGIEMRTGDIVKIEGAYFKNDNGYYYIDHAPGDIGWLGNDFCLHKICKNGKISTAKYSTAFWPLWACCSDQTKNALANDHNAANATIEIIHTIDRAQVIAHFEDEKADHEKAVEYWSRLHGEDSKSATQPRERAAFLGQIIERMKAEDAPGQAQEAPEAVTADEVSTEAQNAPQEAAQSDIDGIVNNLIEAYPAQLDGLLEAAKEAYHKSEEAQRLDAEIDRLKVIKGIFDGTIHPASPTPAQSTLAPSPTLYKYGMSRRGFSIGCQPREGFTERLDDPTGLFYDIIVYNRELTPQEISNFELTPIIDTAPTAPETGTEAETTTATPEAPTEATTEAENVPTEPEQLPDNYYIENKETGKIELHFEKSYYMSLSDSQKREIKSNFLFSRYTKCWISRRKFPNLYSPRKVAESIGLIDAGSHGDRRTFAEQMDIKAAKAEHRAERMEARANRATAAGEALQKPINQMHGDIAFFTQPNINTSAGRAFTNRRNKMWAMWERGIDEFRKSDYYRQRAAAARETADRTKTTDTGFCQRRIDEANKTIRAQKKNIAHYENILSKIEAGEQLKMWGGKPYNPEEVNKWMEDANDIIIEAYGKLAYYDSLIQAAGGIIDKTKVKPGDLVIIRWREPVRVISTKGNKNFIFEFLEPHMRYADGRQMQGQAAYAEIKEIVSQ